MTIWLEVTIVWLIYLDNNSWKNVDKLNWIILLWKQPKTTRIVISLLTIKLIPNLFSKKNILVGKNCKLMQLVFQKWKSKDIGRGIHRRELQGKLYWKKNIRHRRGISKNWIIGLWKFKAIDDKNVWIVIVVFDYIKGFYI